VRILVFGVAGGSSARILTFVTLLGVAGTG
jgi:hypothetical protein